MKKKTKKYGCKLINPSGVKITDWFPFYVVHGDKILTVSHTGCIAIDGCTATSDEVVIFLADAACAEKQDS